VAGNVGFGLRRTARARRAARVEELLDLVGLGGLGRRRPHELSGGQRQRVSLARALAPRPAVMLLDEPFAHLDAGLRDELREEIPAILRRAGATSILVTHDQREALAVGDRVAVMDAGRVLQVGPPPRVFHEPVSARVAVLLGHADVLPGTTRHGRLETELGPLPPRGVPDEDANVDVLVRPDDVEVEPDPAGPGRVVSAAFLGGEVAYLVELPSGATVRGHSRHRAPLPSGTSVRLVPLGLPTAWFPGATAVRGPDGVASAAGRSAAPG
jgi:iron(III) transport system ATP-binding protein